MVDQGGPESGRVKPDDLVPFRAHIIPSSPGVETHAFENLLEAIFLEEAARFSLSPERYEYTNLLKMYQPSSPDLEDNYYLLDTASPAERAVLGNVFGLGELFENLRFSFETVFPRFPGVDVPEGYGPLHEFCNVLNRRIPSQNLAFAYVREYNNNWLYSDHLALVHPVPDLSPVSERSGGVEMHPIHETGRDRLYEMNLKGGRLLIAPVATCSWTTICVEGWSEEDFLHADDDEVPVKDRETDTFHWLNGATPHFFRTELMEARRRISLFLHKERESQGLSPVQEEG